MTRKQAKLPELMLVGPTGYKHASDAPGMKVYTLDDLSARSVGRLSEELTALGSNADSRAYHPLLPPLPPAEMTRATYDMTWARTLGAYLDIWRSDRFGEHDARRFVETSTYLADPDLREIARNPAMAESLVRIAPDMRTRAARTVASYVSTVAGNVDGTDLRATNAFVDSVEPHAALLEASLNLVPADTPEAATLMAALNNPAAVIPRVDQQPAVPRQRWWLGGVTGKRQAGPRR